MPDPAAARPDPSIVPLLAGLSQKLRAVAVISGRDASQLAAFLSVPGLHLIGNHGLEWQEAGVARILPEAEAFLPALAAAKAQLVQMPQVDGVELEAKRVGLSVHFRQAQDPAAAGRALEPRLRALAAELGLSFHPGRMVWELRPGLPIDKGRAVLRLAETFTPEGIVYIGDDVSDQAAFDALAQCPSIRSLKVGVTSGEVPRQVFAACDLLVDGVAGVSQFLAALLERYSGSSPRGVPTRGAL